MPLTIPPEPKEIRADLPPPGYRVLLVSFNDERRKITPRLQLAHTNGAKNAGSIEASKAWAERRTVNGKATTLAHFQVDLDGDAAMLLELDRQGIAAARANPFCISYETADTGYGTDPSISAFTEPQLQKMCNGFAYCHMLYKIALAYPVTWDGNGSASHTEPFGYPYWTSYNGKICPGTKKKAQVRDVILPHARRIVDAWTGSTPVPQPPYVPPPLPEGINDMLPMIGKYPNQGVWVVSFDGGYTHKAIRNKDWANAVVAGGAIAAKTKTVVTSWSPVGDFATTAEVSTYLGAKTG